LILLTLPGPIPLKATRLKQLALCVGKLSEYDFLLLLFGTVIRFHVNYRIIMSVSAHWGRGHGVEQLRMPEQLRQAGQRLCDAE
jgi:hypothetical protein